MSSENNHFEFSFRVLGAEVIGFRMDVDDFKVKWLVWGLVATAALTGTAVYFGLV